MGTYQFKKFNFYTPSTKAIHCLSYNADLCKLALSRSDNTLEIWDVKHTPNVDRVIISDDSIECISWFQNRLFTCGIGGSVTEYDLLRLQVLHEISVISGSCWSIDVNSKKELIAAGTEDGYINIIRIDDQSLTHEKLLDKQQGRILCLKWELNGEFLVTGSIDAIRVWNVRTGHAIHKLTPGRAEGSKCTVVWCLSVTDDFVIVSGDSRGKITFWDGHRGLYIDSHQSHKADILAVCFNKNRTKMYCAGVDPLIASFEKISIKGTGSNAPVKYKWVKSIQRVIHDHDVRALTMCEDKLFSGGIDGYLASSSYPPKVLIKYSPLLQSKKICLAYAAKMILVTYDEHMEIWHWSQKSALSHIAMVKSYQNAHIRCSAISPDGMWIVYSTDNVVRLLQFVLLKNTSKTEIKRVSGLPSEFKSVAVCLCFSPDSKYLAAADKNGIINVIELRSDENIQLAYRLNSDRSELSDVIHLISLSENCEKIVAADRSSNIVIWNKDQYHCSLPKHDSAPTAMAMSCNRENLVVSYADHKFIEYDVNKKKYTQFSRALDIKHPKQWIKRLFPVDGILFDSRNHNIIMIYDDTTICIIDKTKEIPEVSRKIPRLDTVRSPENSDNSESSSSSQFSLNKSDNIAFHILKEFKHLVYLNAFSEKELLAVEVDPDSLTSKLPRTIQKKRFGTM